MEEEEEQEMEEEPRKYSLMRSRVWKVDTSTRYNLKL